MIMGDERLYAEMTGPTILGPIFKSLERKDASSAHALRAAFLKVEKQNPGFSYDLLKGLLQKADVYNQLDMCETLLRLEGTNNDNDYMISRQEPVFQDLNSKAMQLKVILSRIPQEIYDRKKFLETIKDIASAIKHLLDAVNSVFGYIKNMESKHLLEQRKREFVKYSKRFSTTLKDFFRENQKQEVFLSANFLINQTNIIMRTVKESC